MACITTKTTLCGEGVHSLSSRREGAVRLETCPVGDIGVHTSGIGKGICPGTSRAGRGARPTTSLLCEVTRTPYVRVSPKEIYLARENHYTSQARVESNISWTIEIDNL